VKFPKPHTPRDVKYLKFIRSLPCQKCQSTYYVNCHHTETGGMGLIGSDYSAIPLCRECHCGIHQKHGKAGYWEESELKAILDHIQSAYKLSKI
jgi:hypothetical protein